jgi:hypothetical protein
MKKIHLTPPHITLSAHTTWKSPSVYGHIDFQCVPNHKMMSILACRPCLLFSFVFRSNYFEAWHVGNLTKCGGTVKIHKRLTFVTLMKKWRHGHVAVRLTLPGSRQLVCQMNRSRKVRYASDRTLTSRRFFFFTVPESLRKDKFQRSSLIPHNSRNSTLWLWRQWNWKYRSANYVI